MAVVIWRLCDSLKLIGLDLKTTVVKELNAQSLSEKQEHPLPTRSQSHSVWYKDACGQHSLRGSRMGAGEGWKKTSEKARWPMP